MCSHGDSPDPAGDGGMSTSPQLLPVNQLEHFYKGGHRIATFRGAANDSSRRPEEWIASVTTMASDPTRGLSRLADGTLLRDAIVTESRSWLGPAHLDSYGASTELLVKLLDAGQRLPVHLHPDRPFSRRHLGIPHGKTEAWIVLDIAQGARVRLGFSESMSRSQVRAMVEAADSDALVRSLRARTVRPGDAVLVPAGVPHSIDAGVFVLELQEPTDLSILLEAQDLAVDLRKDGHLGLGFDVALTALRLDAMDQSELDTLVMRAERLGKTGLTSLLPAAAEPYFRAHRLRSDEAGPAASGPRVAAGFAVVLAVAGAGLLVPEDGAGLGLRRGDVAVVPFAAGDWRLAGALEVVVCRPPVPPELQAAT
jgi:mannose-6-phosphate isomerase